MSGSSKVTDNADVLNQYRVSAIIRATHGALAAGALVKLSGMSANRVVPATQLRICWDPKSNLCQWVPNGDYLLLRHYLWRQPVDHFWALVWRESLDSSPSYLGNVKSKKFSALPFRFESEGELRYYAAQNNLTGTNYALAEFKLWT